MSSARPNAAPFNVVMIVCDELTTEVLRVFGNARVDTPGVDRLAASGVTFSNAYCNAPVCTPSRYSMLSGRRPWAIDAYHNQSPVPSHVPSIATLLGERGYRTAAIGKMHFRGSDQMWGFQERPYGDFGGLSHQPDPISSAPKLSFVQDAGPAEISESAMQDVIVGDLAASWISEPHSDPFYLHVSFNFPHYPLRPPRRLFDKYYPLRADLPAHPEPPSNEHPWMQERRNAYRELLGDGTHGADAIRRARAAYFGCVELMDEQLVKVLDALAANGLDGSTAVFFTSDHGEMLGEHGTWEKNCFYEQAVKVPLIVRLPDGPDPGRRRDEVVELVDMFPTIEELSRSDRQSGRSPRTVETDGESLCSLIHSTGTRSKDYAISELCPTYVEGVARMVRCDRWKYIVYDNASPSLFDVSDDPHEIHDLGLASDARELVDSRIEALADVDMDRVQARSRSGLLATHPLYLGMTPNQFRDPSGELTAAEEFYPDDLTWATPPRSPTAKVRKVRPDPPAVDGAG